jgi:hypothetical protein
MSQTENTASGVHDFDFFVGRLHVHHRRLKERLANNHDWTEFEGTTVTRKLMGGYGNVDDNVLEYPGGAYRAVTLRSFDPSSRHGRSGGWIAGHQRVRWTRLFRVTSRTGWVRSMPTTRSMENPSASER